MPINWTGKARNSSDNAYLYKAKVDRVPVGKIVYDGGYTEYYSKGRDYYSEAELIAGVKHEAGKKSGAGGFYKVATFDYDSQEMTCKPVTVMADDFDEAALKGSQKLRLEAKGYQGSILVTDHEGSRYHYRLQDDEDEVTQFWRRSKKRLR